MVAERWGAMPRRPEDSTVWIAYADFLTTMAVLFLLFAVAFAARLPPVGAGFVTGQVLDLKSRHDIDDCLVKLGETRQGRTTSAGLFEFQVDSIGGHVPLGLAVTCRGYAEHREVIQVRARDTINLTIALSPADSNTAYVDILPGDALFATNQYTLKGSAEALIQHIGVELRQKLTPGDIILVQGHTDDVPFGGQAQGRDNWVLSGQRAAAAAHVLTSSEYGVNLPPCRIATMGFGPSRPIDAVEPGDRAAVLRAKRAKNRRIEFRKVRGSELAAGSCE